MASSVERLDLYANWNGSREGRTDLMCCMTSRSKHFMGIGVMRKASGWAVCCSLMCWYKSCSASLLLMLLELGGMYTATSRMAVYSLGR